MSAIQIDIIKCGQDCNCDMCRAVKALQKEANGTEIEKTEQNCCSICGAEIFECSDEVPPTVSKRTEHEQVMVKVEDIEANIDKDLAPLIEQLWKAGFMTDMSCQEIGPGIAWISFWETTQLAMFLEIVGDYDPDLNSLYSRITKLADEGCWEYSLWPKDLNLDETLTEDDCIEYSHYGEPVFDFSVSIYFPKTDIPILLDRMVRHHSTHDYAKRRAEVRAELDLLLQKEPAMLIPCAT